MTRLSAIGTASMLGLFGLGCASAPTETRRDRDGETPNTGSAIVLDGEDFRGRGQTLLRLMAERVTALRAWAKGRTVPAE